MNEINNPQLRKVISEFFDVDKVVSIEPYGNGHINKTYVVTFHDCRYILQQINHHVFNSPFGVMHNIELVTNHIRKKVIFNGKNPRNAVLNTVNTKYGEIIAIVDNEYWRCLEFIENGIAYDIIENEQMFEEVGRVIGEFQRLLNDFHTRLLDDNIKHFHDTPYRYAHFQDVCKLDKYERVNTCQEEIDFINERRDVMSLITDALFERRIKRRVTHNDTKLSNVLIDKNTGKALCLIDLDTVMKGSVLYDFGDALRLGASTAVEDEKDLSKVNIDLGLIEAFTRGFLKEIKTIMQKSEFDLLYYGYLIITLEISMRFLDDYLDGDHYFHVAYPDHNLIRAKNQIKIVKEIEKNKDRINEIFQKLYDELDCHMENN